MNGNETCSVRVQRTSRQRKRIVGEDQRSLFVNVPRHNFDLQKSVMKRRILHRCGLTLLLGGALMLPLSAEPSNESRPQKDAGYVLTDGTIQIVGFDDMEGIIESLNTLFVRSHPGIKFKFVKANSIAAMHSLVFDETAFAPTGM